MDDSKRVADFDCYASPPPTKFCAQVNKFNREITVTSEVRELPDGTSAEVTALYVGISTAYYVSRDGSAAGMGTASPDGWVWTPANDDAAQIAKAIAILKNEQVASFVKLPIDIK